MISSLVVKQCVRRSSPIAGTHNAIRNINSNIGIGYCSTRKQMLHPLPSTIVSRVARNSNVSNVRNNASLRTMSSVPNTAADSAVTTSASSSTSSASTSAGAAASNAPGGINAAGSIFFSSLCVLTFGLGCWQTKRYFEKIKMTKKRQDDLLLDPFRGYEDWLGFKNGGATANDSSNDATNNSNDANNDKSYRRVHLRGSFLHQHELLVGPRGPPPGALSESGPNSGRGGGGGGMSSSMQGYWVVTPFLIGGDDLVVEDSMETVGNSDGNVKGDDATFKSSSKRRWFHGLFRGGRTTQASSDKDIDANSQNRNTEMESARLASLSSNNATSSSTKEETIVWINRGWIPRHFATSAANNINKEKVLESTSSWEQPQGTIQLLAMESQTETPGRFSPPSRLETNSNKQQHTQGQAQSHQKLLWMDREAINELTQCPKGCHPHLFVEIHKHTEDAHGDNEKKARKVPQFPVKPPQEFVGEFKVTPEVHAGYAVTWFGLASAGMVMTRKLIRRIR